MSVGGQRWARDDDLVPYDRLRRWSCVPEAHATLAVSWHVGASCARWRLATRYDTVTGYLHLDEPARAVDVLPMALEACRRLLHRV